MAQNRNTGETSYWGLLLFTIPTCRSGTFCLQLCNSQVGRREDQGHRLWNSWSLFCFSSRLYPPGAAWHHVAGNRLGSRAARLFQQQSRMSEGRLRPGCLPVASVSSSGSLPTSHVDGGQCPGHPCRSRSWLRLRAAAVSSQREGAACGGEHGGEGGLESPVLPASRPDKRPT